MNVGSTKSRCDHPRILIQSLAYQEWLVKNEEFPSPTLYLVCHEFMEIAISNMPENSRAPSCWRSSNWPTKKRYDPCKSKNPRIGPWRLNIGERGGGPYVITHVHIHIPYTLFQEYFQARRKRAHADWTAYDAAKGATHATTLSHCLSQSMRAMEDGRAFQVGRNHSRSGFLIPD